MDPLRIGIARGVLGLLLVGGLSPWAQAVTVTIAPSQDGTLYQEPSGSLANGEGDHIFVGRTDQPDSLSRRRAVLRFNLASVIPDNATIIDVQLTLNMSRTIGGSNTIAIHRLLKDWGEGPSHAPGEEGGGAAAAPQDATWVHTYYDTDTWTTEGGDFDPTARATQTVVGLGPYTWGSTTELVADVQAWVDNPSTNYGWIMIGNEVDLIIPTSKRFDSRENATPGVQPALRVEFAEEVPATSTWALIALALLIVCAGSFRIRQPAVSVTV